MKVIYIAGPYRDPRGEYYINENINIAKSHALSVWREGGVALCPHANTALFGGAWGIQDDVWLKGDLELIKRCDAVWAMAAYKKSQGACNEIEYAQEIGIPVLYNYEEMKEFIKGG